jgi:hypothetical protein
MRGGASVATPLLLALVCVELSDVLFAVDSVRKQQNTPPEYKNAPARLIKARNLSW